MISADNVIAAINRWISFQDVQTFQAEPSRQAEAIYAAESPDALVEAHSAPQADELSSALLRVKDGLGMTRGAQIAFWGEIGRATEGLEALPVGQAIEQAALIGMAVGLTARQLADEKTTEVVAGVSLNGETESQ